MRNSMIVFAIIIIILITGYAFNDETVSVSVLDSSYVTSYFGVATIIVYFLVLLLLLRYLFQNKDDDSKNPDLK